MAECKAIYVAAIAEGEMREWRDLGKDEQLRLRLDYQAELDREPRTCSLDEKMERFTNWLAGQGVRFSPEDLARR